MVENYDLKVRTKQCALQMIRLYSSLPKTTEAQVIGKQVLRSGTSVGAQYREAQRAKLTPISSTRSKVLCRSWTKQIIGLNCLKTQEYFLLKN